MDNGSIYSTKKELLKFLGIKDNFLYSDFSRKYYEKDLPKKTGGFRKIRPPELNLKKSQRIILDKILVNEKQLPCVYGLSKSKNILNNAKAHFHNKNNQLLTLDIEKFFPSISKNRILNVFRKMGFSKENASILTKICTINNELPQGAPTSPYLASLVCVKLDKSIFLYCKRRSLTYTRYFDDITISGIEINQKNIQDIEKLIYRESFQLNNKTHFYRAGEYKIVNSIVITNDKLTVTEGYKTEIIDAYINYIKNKDLFTERIFKGKFGFFLHVNKSEAISFLNDIKKQNERLQG